ncbi:hypothetical protein HYH03_007340 [Edaphochlamys debaryana]|uniref:Uncharacterized protein n=1 Tax=Edaphochlamys debaryana TaxID=47281 RepID=A0A836C0K6_9CHLO|nr:hypothetical protein HYH03_007340 [Edaphochlamys debaryana]|eukprot:KAG2494574.1 hypothetical protein HYH03_007340 [Edaphochlamys debaryana]
MLRPEAVASLLQLLAAGLPGLKLTECRMPPELWSALPSASALTSLSLSWHRGALEAAHVSTLASLTQLRSLELGMGCLGELVPMLIGPLTELTHLKLSWRSGRKKDAEGPASLEAFAHLPRLVDVDLSGCDGEMEVRGLERLTVLTRLQVPSLITQRGADRTSWRWRNVYYDIGDADTDPPEPQGPAPPLPLPPGLQELWVWGVMSVGVMSSLRPATAGLPKVSVGGTACTIMREDVLLSLIPGAHVSPDHDLLPEAAEALVAAAAFLAGRLVSYGDGLRRFAPAPLLPVGAAAWILDGLISSDDGGMADNLTSDDEESGEDSSGGSDSGSEEGGVGSHGDAPGPSRGGTGPSGIGDGPSSGGAGGAAGPGKRHSPTCADLAPLGCAAEGPDEMGSEETGGSEEDEGPGASGRDGESGEGEASDGGWGEAPRHARWLRALGALQPNKLVLRSIGLAPPDLAVIADSMPGLQHLSLQAGVFSFPALTCLGRLPRLRMLNLCVEHMWSEGEPVPVAATAGQLIELFTAAAATATAAAATAASDGQAGPSSAGAAAGAEVFRLSDCTWGRDSEYDEFWKRVPAGLLVEIEFNCDSDVSEDLYILQERVNKLVKQRGLPSILELRPTNYC